MPDQDNKTSQPSVDANVSPPLPTTDASTAPPPPIIEEQPMTPPPPSTQDIPPPPEEGTTGAGIPPVVTTPGGKPKRKTSKKGKIIATILGILFLVGGVSAGVILVQKQQDIREKAALPRACKICSASNACVPTNVACLPELNECELDSDCAPEQPPPPTPVPECLFDDDCPVGEECVSNKCRVPPAQPPPTEPLADYCSSSGCDVGTDFNPGANGCWVNRYHCETRSPGGCGGQANLKEQGQRSISFQESCGTEQIDVTDGCPKDSYPENNQLADFKSKTYSNDCGATPPPDGAISAQCLNIQAFDTNWNKITDLSTLKAGDIVRFTVAGTTTSGSIDKARFTINATQRPAVTQKRPATNEFFDEYTIPEGVTSFSINAQLHHTDPTIGWF